MADDDSSAAGSRPTITTPPVERTQLLSASDSVLNNDDQTAANKAVEDAAYVECAAAAADAAHNAKVATAAEIIVESEAAKQVSGMSLLFAALWHMHIRNVDLHERVDCIAGFSTCNGSKGSHAGCARCRSISPKSPGRASSQGA